MDAPAACAGLAEALLRGRVRAAVAPHMRSVLHPDPSRSDLQRAAGVFAAYFGNWQA